MKKLAAYSLMLAAFSAPGAAQTPPDQPIDGATRQAVVRSLGEELRKNYVFPEVAEQVSKELSRKERAKAYDSATTARAFAEMLHADLQELGKDRHFRVGYAPGFVAAPADDAALTDEQLAELKVRAEQTGYGVRRVSRLPGNIGYLDVTGFGTPEFVAPAYEAAMKLLDGSDAIVIDLRDNGGGDPESVAQLASHFFAAGDVRHLNSIYTRPTDTTHEFWTSRTAATRFTGPVFLVTSARTFSGGEGFAYELQAQKRVTVIGETTGGGANPGGTVKLAGGFAAFIPNGRAINPVTGTNWEHVGVKPDVEVAATDALARAYEAALTASMEREPNPERQAAYVAVIERAKAGEVPLPEWKPRGR